MFVDVDSGRFTYDLNAMPGQRASNKKQFTAAFTKEELAKIDEMANKMGISRTEFLRRAAMEAVESANSNKV